jgi:UDP-glucose 4-epimerase
VRLAEEFDVPRFVFLSSGGAIYGKVRRPAIETDLPAPESHYGLNKLAAEQILRVSRLSYAILRPANIYGPRQRSDAEGGVVAIFLERLLRGEALELHGTGQQSRDFVYVEDVVSAVELALKRPESDIWNVATGVPTSIAELARLVSKLTCSSLDVHTTPRREGDVDYSLLSPARILSTGCWGPPTELRAGLESYVLGETRDTAGVDGTKVVGVR